MRVKLVVLGLCVVALAVLPIPLSEFRTAQLATVGAYLIAILGLDVLTGHSGQISLGHGAFMAVGAYTTAILMTDHGVRDVWTIPIAAVVAGGIGLLAGVPALRGRGLHLALATFGIAVALPTILTKFDHFTGGAKGITLSGRPTQTGHGAGVWWLTNSQWLYALTWTTAVVCFLIAWWLLDSRFGWSLRAIRDGDLAAAASGINRSAYRAAALGASAMFAGVAGALLAIDRAYVSPDAFGLQLSLLLLVGAVVGFFGSIWGAPLGALLIQYLPDLVGSIPHVNTSRPGPTTFFFGVILVVLMLALPLARRARALIALRGHS